MGTRAIVIGASMAGLLTARVLSEHADEVLVLERDELPIDNEQRRGVPQGRHAHALLAAGEQLVEEWFPGIVDELVAAGAVRGDGGDSRWYQSGAFKVRTDTGVPATCMSRPLLEGTVRRRVSQRPNVTVRSGVGVGSLVVSGPRITGVVVDGDAVGSDLVVDCTGRNSRFLDQLASAAFDAPAISAVKIDMSYATRILRRRDGDLDATFGIIAPTPPFDNRFGVLLPLEGDRWILTMGGFHGDTCPTDDEGYLAFARSLAVPFLADLLERAEVLSPVMTHRMATSQRRHVEKMRHAPAGFLVLGDAICSFNPIYGQGMSSAAQQAKALENCLGRQALGSSSLAHSFYRKAAKVVDNPWQIAVGGDFLHPSTTGPKPPGTDLVNRYVGKVQLASHVSPDVLTALTRVQNLLDPPPSLMRPSMMWKVRRAARRSPAAGRRPIGDPHSRSADEVSQPA